MVDIPTMSEIECFMCGVFGTKDVDKPISVSLSFFVVPIENMVCNTYLTCRPHSRIPLVFDDFYNKDGTRRELEETKKIIIERFAYKDSEVNDE